MSTRTATASLSAVMAHQVDATVRARGRDYFHSGLVLNLRGDDQLVQARVAGTRTYHVEIRVELHDRSLSVACDCPFCLDGKGICKHIWAVILAAEQRELFSSIPIGRLVAVYIGGDFDDSDSDVASTDDVTGFDPLRSGRPATSPRRPQAPKPPPVPKWRRQLDELRTAAIDQARTSAPRGQVASARDVLYIVNRNVSHDLGRLSIDLATRQRKTNGDWGKLKYEGYSPLQICDLSDPLDQKIVALLQGADDRRSSYGWDGPSSGPATWHHVPPPTLLNEVAAMMASTGRCSIRLTDRDDSLAPLRWDDGDPWQLRIHVQPQEASGEHVLVSARVCRAGESRLLESAPLAVAGLIVFDGVMAPLKDAGAIGWIDSLQRGAGLTVPREQIDDLIRTLAGLPKLPPIDMDDSLEVQVVQAAPTQRLLLRPAAGTPRPGDLLEAIVSFDYDGSVIASADERSALYRANPRRLVRRDPAAERAAFRRLADLGFREPHAYYRRADSILNLAPKRMPEVVRTLTAENWRVEASGKLIRLAGKVSLNVASGIDWFELQGEVRFDDRVVGLPELLKAVRRGETSVVLDDGTLGLLPEQWLKQYAPLANLGQDQGGGVRFSRCQIGFLDAMVASMPEASFDATFARAREQLRSFERIEPADPPGSFVGTLRPYQREGLGWLAFLNRFEFGGCLADDMGLGKTIQVLALLESHRAQRASAAAPGDAAAPSLVVAPRSLVFNWKQEAARFTPLMRVLEHTGIDRPKEAAAFSGHDLVLTTYGTLRRDAAMLKDVRFDYVILDESQMIKNAGTDSAKAARLLQAGHRLALSGTPIENHLGELWSLMEFLNPGMLGRSSALHLGDSPGRRTPAEDADRQLLARAVRPFILRRTKDKVARDLPARQEQTISCELEAAQRRLYNELRDHYRQSLLGRIERDGLARSKIHVLEALLRLRQAACHPGLIDKSRCDEPSAKLDSLLPQLREVVEEGHKALVFSQFTSLLAILRRRLDAEKVTYEYLDGRTRDRAERVQRFQDDPTCPLFLISLKAGGLGLNLTAAEYVFLLDPWWNPAVEAQAIDRAHRIGQTRQVFAYRLIARDTVEERVLELQQSKRDLADSIIRADDSLIRTLKREDLELLLR